VDDIVAELTNTPLRLFDTDLQILENNIYGVDINDESIEIAKLSLWLRTAQTGRKLSDLSRNIRCGNSLIDDPAVAGDKAFNWQQAFPDVFAKGGFDVVIGNPPYVDIKALPQIMVKVLFNKFNTAENRINLYSIFIERGYEITKKGGFLSYINPNSILINSSYAKIRKLLVDDVSNIIKLPDNVFPDASVETIIFEFQKSTPSNTVDVIAYSKNDQISSIENSLKKTIGKIDWKKNTDCNYDIYSSESEITLLKKIRKNSKEKYC
jgi:type I restriction-modification system DNA methylase subunit